MKQTLYRQNARIRPGGKLELTVPFPAGALVEVQVVVLEEPADDLEVVEPVSRRRPIRREDTLDVLDEEEAGDNPSPILRGIYSLFILAGLALAFYLYIVAFDNFSETQLIALSGAWVFPLVFGIYGFISQHLVHAVRSGKAYTIAAAVREWAEPLGGYAYLVLMLLLPFLLLKKWRYSLPVAITATMFWVVLSAIFFAAIFPTL